ncbi:hypothetical protein K0B04_01125 [Patescibacteria group bacterium]|nr:hypothetical protein [Patescibacteria group bacterium]
MVYLTYLSGPHKGRKRNVTKVDPEIIFHKILKFGWGWEIEYFEATEDEEDLWWGYDVGTRISRALKEGRPVHYMGKVYIANNPSEVVKVAREVSDDINRSAHEFGLESDDEYGVVIGAYRCLN